MSWEVQQWTMFTPDKNTWIFLRMLLRGPSEPDPLLLLLFFIHALHLWWKDSHKEKHNASVQRHARARVCHKVITFNCRSIQRGSYRTLGLNTSIGTSTCESHPRDSGCVWTSITWRRGLCRTPGGQPARLRASRAGCSSFCSACFRIPWKVCVVDYNFTESTRECLLLALGAACLLNPGSVTWWETDGAGLSLSTHARSLSRSPRIYFWIRKQITFLTATAWSTSYSKPHRLLKMRECNEVWLSLFFVLQENTLAACFRNQTSYLVGLVSFTSHVLLPAPVNFLKHVSPHFDCPVSFQCIYSISRVL